MCSRLAEPRQSASISTRFTRTKLARDSRRHLTARAHLVLPPEGSAEQPSRLTGLAPWNDQHSENRAGEQELHRCGERSIPVPPQAVVKDLPSAGAQEREDVLEIRSGQLATAPTVTGSSGPRRTARRAMPAIPVPISNRAEWKSRCGTRSPARCRAGPRRTAASREPVAAPSAAPVATWRATITDA